MRRFENSTGRFWQIEQTDLGLRVTWGQNPGPGQQRDIRLGSGPGVAAKLDEMVAKQLALGYVEVIDEHVVTSSLVVGKRWFAKLGNAEHSVAVAAERDRVWIWHDDIATPDEQIAASFADLKERVAKALHDGFANRMEWIRDARDPHAAGSDVVNLALEAQCEAAPDDPQPWAVLADYLVDHGDPRGAIARLFQAGHAPDAEAELTARQFQLFREARGVRIDGWRHGFARAATVEAMDGQRIADAVAQFLDLSLSRFVEVLTLGDDEWRDAIAVLEQHAIGSRLRSLTLGTARHSELDSYRAGDVSRLWQLPLLEHVAINAHTAELGTIASSSLKRFTRVASELAPAELRALRGASLPQLERLELALGQWYEDADLLELVDAIGKGLFPALKHLGLRACAHSLAVLQLLAGSPALAKLTSLDLSRGVAGAAEARLLRDRADQFQHLDRLNLDENYLDEADLAMLHAALPGFASHEQRDPQDDHGVDDWRYAVLGE